jgi:galactonate dehydratase
VRRSYCAEYLVGKDPLHIERHWQHMFRRQLFRGGSDVMAAIGAIDIALWDIKGKSLDKPVYELLGGPTREKVILPRKSGHSQAAIVDNCCSNWSGVT